MKRILELHLAVPNDKNINEQCTILGGVKSLYMKIATGLSSIIF